MSIIVSRRRLRRRRPPRPTIVYVTPPVTAQPVPTTLEIPWTPILAIGGALILVYLLVKSK